MDLTVDGIVVHVQRKAIKNLYLRVKEPDGEVYASAPLHVKNERIEAFVRQKAEWIGKQRDRIRTRAAAAGDENTLILLGRAYPIVTKVGVSHNNAILSDRCLSLFLRADCTHEERDALLRELCRKELEKEIGLLLSTWESRTRLRASSWHIRSMKTRWGTCNVRDRRLCFSLKLAHKPTRCVEYVVLHEVAHLKVPNHGKDFVALMDTYMPDWRDRRRELNGVRDENAPR